MFYLASKSFIPDLNHVDDNYRQSTLDSGIPPSLEPQQLSTIPPKITNAEPTTVEEVVEELPDTALPENETDEELNVENEGETIFDVQEEGQLLPTISTDHHKTTTVEEKGQ